MSDLPSDTLNAIETVIGHRFRDPAHLATALSHTSWVHESQAGDPALVSNQRYEFLGDAVLGLVVSGILLEKYPEAREGDLSKLRAQLVCTPALARLAIHWSLDTHIRLSSGEILQGGRKKPSVLADATEALIAAVYLDGGIGAVTSVIERSWQILSGPAGSMDLTDWKSRLQEYAQKGGGTLPEYQILSAEGPDHAKIFTIKCIVSGRDATGTGPSKKAAEQDAARKVLLSLTDQSKDWEL